jgi:NifU-like protein involved in Fe-S cluster formation
MSSSTLMDHFMNPRNAGTLEAPDGVGRAGTPGSGQFAVIQVRVRGGYVTEARFQTFGCGAAIAACSALTEWATGRKVAEAAAVTSEQLIELLGGLPSDKHYCAGLAVEALHRALKAVGEGR